MVRALGLVAGILAGLVVGCAGGGDRDDNAADSEVVAGASQLVLHYEPARKAEMIENKVFKPQDFTGNDVIVKDARTSIDIATLLPESDTTAPDTICYRGKFDDVKKILDTTLGNTDGNGDHFLKKGSRIDADAAGKITVRFTVIGEGGEVAQELEVPRC